MNGRPWQLTALPVSGVVALAACLILQAGAPAHAQDREMAPVTDAMLLDPDPADWINWRRTLDGWGYSPLDQIDTGNADRLRLVWSWAISSEGRPEPNPLVYDGVMYVASPFGIVEALDAATGEFLWRYRHEHATDDLGGIVTTRNLAIYDDKVYLTTIDAHIVALDARTGAVVWNVEGADHTLGFRYSAGPIVVRGKVIASTNGCERYHEAKEMPCFLSARDARTGEELWRTSTVARPGEPGGDTWGDTPLMFRIGGDSWTAGSYDPRTDLIYWATAQAKPWARFQRGHSGDALYTNSVLALDPDTGAIVWYNQLLPGETHDMDETFENLLVDHGERRSLFKMGKLAILWELDRATGQTLAAHDLGYQTILDVDPRTGAITYRPGMIPQEGVELTFCPSVAGFKSWRAMAYHPDTRAFYIPLIASCERTTFGPGPERVEGGGGVGPVAPPAPAASAAAGRRRGARRHRRRRERAVAPPDAHRHRQCGAHDRRRAGRGRRLGPQPVCLRRPLGRHPVPDADAELGLGLPDQLRRRRPAVPGHPGGNGSLALEQHLGPAHAGEEPPRGGRPRDLRLRRARCVARGPVNDAMTQGGDR